MNKMRNVIFIVIIMAIIGFGFLLYQKFYKSSDTNNISSEQTFNTISVPETSGFSDGLPEPDSITTYPLQEFERGISEKSEYMIDINKDGKPDRITKSFFNNGNAHSYYKYTIEINQGGKYINITPDNLQTVNGADCDLRQIQFKFKPYFHIIIISREMGETWDEPTMAYKQTFSLNNNSLQKSEKKQMKPICDVKEIF